MRRFIRIALAGLALAIASTGGAMAQHGQDPNKLSLGVQATGTVKWELAAMAALGIDKKHLLELDVRDVADSKAGQIALQAKEVDVILSDFVWVSIQRHEGNMVTMVPHSLTVGGLMVDPAAGINSVADLKGKTLAVSGSPVDKSYVILAAEYNKLTGGNLTEDASAKFGAPPLVNELITGGQAQAALNLWNWNSRAKLAGKTELISVAAMLADLGVSETPPLLGWTFFDETAHAKKEAIKAFLDASFETKKALLEDDGVWDKIRDVMNVGDDDKLFAQLRDDYRAGIVTKYASSAMQPAEQAFELMARYGGADVVGSSTELADGTFYKGYRK
ncbi:MAG: ABC transporter substrate-binding protein [Devosia sp.]|uniref:ABC transporter substrate-binding protein n=1 Tax=Devosia sp. TaxID=1871048 RepID=UPI001AC928B0|nr:ABC transporter substrate-binding protein [Devosia sp.]MBN9316610.1 ABC transporter substrate-binding protein [Devosia sp.]